MFGALRLILAALVVLSHFAGVVLVGWLAVQVFLVLSGFLITGVVTRIYGHNVDGFVRFVATRFLRLFPTYWVLLCVGALALASLPADAVGQLSGVLGLPKSLGEWAMNISLVYPSVFPGNLEAKISPPTWTLTVELFYYVLIGVGLTASERLARGALFWGALYIAVVWMAGAPVALHYGAIMAGLFPFALGGWLYHVRGRAGPSLSWLQGSAGVTMAVSLCLWNALMCALLASDQPGAGFYVVFHLNTVLAGVLILALDRAPTSERAARWDRWLGDLSYPVYIVHVPLGVALSHHLLGRVEAGMDTTGLLATGLALAGSVGVSVVVVRVVDPKVARWRRALRGREPLSSPPKA